MKNVDCLVVWLCILGFNGSISEAAKRASLEKYSRIETGWKRDEIDGDTGQGGEVNKFEFDFEYYTNCKLPQKPFFVKKYYLKEGDHHYKFKESAVMYIAGLNENILKEDDPPEKVLEDHHIAHRLCAEGKFRDTNWMETSKQGDVGEEGNNKPATRCGLGTILSYLCYLDKEVEPSIKGSTSNGYDFASELKKKKEDEKRAAENLKLYTEKYCKWILKIFSVHASPSVGGRAYVYGALDAGYQILLAMNKEEEDGFSSFETATISSEFQKPENQPRWTSVKLEDPFLDKFIKKHGRSWYFCKKM